MKSVSLGQYGGKASYRPGERPSTTMTAEALVCRQFLGMAKENPATDEAADYLLTQPPTSQRINLYYWYYGTLGMYQLQDDRWQRWNTAIQTTLISRQRTDDELAGSWDPECVWGGYGGRVYSTALSALLSRGLLSLSADLSIGQQAIENRYLPHFTSDFPRRRPASRFDRQPATAQEFS